MMKNPKIDSFKVYSDPENREIDHHGSDGKSDHQGSDGKTGNRSSRRPNKARGDRVSLSNLDNQTPQSKVLQGKKKDLDIPGSTTAIRKTTGKRISASFNQATTDPATLTVLSDMLNCGILDEINGCISAGKQANVYHATKRDGQEFAVKVYNTSGYLKHKSGKSVRTLADTEMSNLKRLKEAGISCPTPVFSRLHVLVMEFIGKSGRAAPRLKDANLTEDKMRDSYVQMIMVVRDLYQKCKLVHGYLREDNILYYEGNLHLIDVSQCVGLDHPHALDRLRMDCIFVLDFFRKNGVEFVSTQELLDFIVDSSITDEYVEEVGQKILAGGERMSMVGCTESDFRMGYGVTCYSRFAYTDTNNLVCQSDNSGTDDDDDITHDPEYDWVAAMFPELAMERNTIGSQSVSQNKAPKLPNKNEEVEDDGYINVFSD